MNSTMMSAKQTSFHLPPDTPLSSRNSILEPSSFISFKTHLQKPDFSIKISSGSSHKSRTKAAINEPPAQTAQSFYELLGISESGTLSEIKKAYKELARKYHPDVSPADQAEENTERFILVKEAYETLSDPRTKALYDRDLSKGLHLAFSARRGNYDQKSEVRGEWKNRWESQLQELERMSINRDSRESWGARMRRQRSDPFSL